MLTMHRISLERTKLFNESTGLRLKRTDVRLPSCIFFFSLYKHESLYKLLFMVYACYKGNDHFIYIYISQLTQVV